MIGVPDSDDGWGSLDFRMCVDCSREATHCHSKDKSTVWWELKLNNFQSVANAIRRFRQEVKLTRCDFYVLVVTLSSSFPAELLQSAGKEIQKTGKPFHLVFTGADACDSDALLARSKMVTDIFRQDGVYPYGTFAISNLPENKNRFDFPRLKESLQLTSPICMLLRK